jgi:putative membrane protein
MKKHVRILGFAPAFALAACGNDDTIAGAGMNNGDMVTNLPAGEMMGENAMPDAAMNNSGMAAMSGQQFADMIAASDAYEIEAGKLAQQKAAASDLKDFGKEMVEDHSESTRLLKEAAAQASPAITPAAAMNAEQQANLATLRTATGSDFDTAYKSQQVAAHEKALAALRSYATNGDVPQLKSFAGTVVDTVSEHYDEIKGM